MKGELDKLDDINVKSMFDSDVVKGTFWSLFAYFSSIPTLLLRLC